MKAPSTPNETFELLANYTESGGIEALLDEADWSHSTLDQVRTALLPPNADLPDGEWSRSGSRALADAILRGPEFQNNARSLALQAFADKTRLLFAHIPKSGGTTVNSLMKRNFPSLHQQLTEPSWLAQNAFYEAMRDNSEKARGVDWIYISGHYSLRWYLASGMRRSNDRIFTVVRRPYEIVLSQVNYYIRRILEDPSCEAPDTKHWAGQIGLTQFDASQTPDQLKSFALELLDNDSLTSKKLLSTYLGDGTARSAIELIEETGVEIIRLDGLQEWMRDTWGIDDDLVDNRSDPILEWAALDGDRKRRLVEACAEDMALYQHIVTRKLPEKMAPLGEAAR